MADTQGKRKRKKSGQLFSISAAARTFNPRDISRMSEEEAYDYFVGIRFKDNGGKAQCPHCGCGACYEYRARRIFKCMSCERQFSATSGTEFSRRKMSFRQILELIVEFALPAKGISAIQISKNLGLSYRTAFYRLHHLRRAMLRSHEGTVFDTPVEIDGAEVGGHIRPKNKKEDRKDRRRYPYRSKNKQVVGVMRERCPGGRTRVVIAKTEGKAAKLMPKFIKPGTSIYADGGTAFNFLSKKYPMHRVTHAVEYWRKPNVHTNNAECFFSVLRRAERGIYHHIAGPYFEAYANEVAWRQDRRQSDTKAVFEDLCGQVIVPFKPRPVTPAEFFVQRVTEEPVQQGAAWNKCKRSCAVVVQVTKIKTKSEIRKEMKRTIGRVDEELVAYIFRNQKWNFRSLNKR